MTLLITGLAVYRITRLIVDDTILERFRIAFAGKSEWRYSLVTCYWCAGFWVQRGGDSHPLLHVECCPTRSGLVAPTVRPVRRDGHPRGQGVT